MDRVSVIGALERQRFAVCDHPVFPDRMDQLGQSKLSIPERCAHAFFHDPALKIDRLPGRWRKLDTGNVFQDGVARARAETNAIVKSRQQDSSCRKAGATMILVWLSYLWKS